MHVEADKYNTGALVQKYEAGIKGFFKDEDLVREFQKLESVKDKLTFIWKSKSMQTFLRDSSERDGGKSEGDNKRFKEFGNNHFKAGRDKEAARMYGEAARTAPVKEGKSKELGVALANRSAALVRLGKDQLALQDIQLALEAGYPSELRYKLMDRKVKIAVKLQDRAGYHEALADLKASLEDSSLDQAKKDELVNGAESLLSELDKEQKVEEVDVKPKTKVELKEPCPFLPSLSNSIDIEWTEARGRFAIANRPIPAGTLLLVEDPLAAVVLGDQDIGARCDQCLKRTELVTIPCLCCAHVSYCCLECRQIAKESHHQYECGTRDLLRALSGSQATRDIGRLCFRALCSKPASWYMENRESLNERFPMFGDETWEKTPQHAVLSLEHHPGRIEPGRLWSFLLCALCHIRALQMGGYFGPERTGNVAGKLTPDEVEVAAWAVTLLQVELYNMQGVTGGTELDKCIGNGLYPTTSLINHCCESNVTKCFSGSRLVLVASRDIMEREEIAESYLPGGGDQLDRDQRRAYLHHFYKFLCECPVCASEESEIEEAEKKAETMDEKKVETEKKDNDAAAHIETVEKKREDLEEEGDKKESTTTKKEETTTIEGLQAA